MSVKRLILDTGKLDQDRIIGTGTVVLDTRAVLDTNIIFGTGYDASLGYDSNVTLYDGASVIYDFAASELGGLTGTVQSTPQIIVSASSELGAISSIAQSGVAHFAQGATNLGGITAEADTTPTILPLFDATFGSLNSSLTAVVTRIATATATLGELTGSVQATPEVEITAAANLGSLTATAQASTPTPPEPAHYGSNGYVPIKKKQKKERPTPVIVVEITDVPELEPLIKTHFAKGTTDLFGISAQAGNRIDFSILADEAEILMLL
jgi:hypothetical protein